MKKLIILLILVSGSPFIKTACAQTSPTFSGAQATQDRYSALYIINTADMKHITGTLRNIKNALNDPRLKGKLEVELIAFGDGVAVYQKSGPFEQTLKDLQAKGVILAQCENTLKERKISKTALFPFISFVPSGNGEIIIRQHEGWAIVHP